MIKEKPNYYAIITANVRYDKELTANAKLLYAEITALCNMNGNCTASSEYFCKLYNVSRVSIQKWLSQLEKNGYIKRKVTYKKGSKQIDTRYITIINNPSKEKLTTPSKEKLTDNTNISKDIYKNNNITYSNNKKDSMLPYDNIVAFLNSKTGSKFSSKSESNKRLIRSRFNEGYTEQDFYQVINSMCAKWLKDNKMKQYLRPVTLFGAKFDNYLNVVIDDLDKQVLQGKISDTTAENIRTMQEWLNDET